MRDYWRAKRLKELEISALPPLSVEEIYIDETGEEKHTYPPPPDTLPWLTIPRIIKIIRESLGVELWVSPSFHKGDYILNGIKWITPDEKETIIFLEDSGDPDKLLEKLVDLFLGYYEEMGS